MSHTVVVAPLCALILYLCAFDTTLKGSERMLVSYERDLLDDVCPATFLAVVAHALFLIVGVSVVMGAESEHALCILKDKARQASALRHAQQAEPSTKAALVKSPAAELEQAGLTTKQQVNARGRRRASAKSFTAATKEYGKVLSDTDTDVSSDSESSDVGESGGCYESARSQAEGKSRVEATALQDAVHDAVGTPVHRLVVGGDMREACADGWTRLAVSRAADTAQSSPRAARPCSMPDAFLCPLTLEPMQDPVVTCDGQTYERGAIEQWLAQSSTSPLTGQQLPHLGLAPNVVLRGLICDALERRLERPSR